MSDTSFCGETLISHRRENKFKKFRCKTTANKGQHGCPTPTKHCSAISTGKHKFPSLLPFQLFLRYPLPLCSPHRCDLLYRSAPTFQPSFDLPPPPSPAMDFWVHHHARSYEEYRRHSLRRRIHLLGRGIDIGNSTSYLGLCAAFCCNTLHSIDHDRSWKVQNLAKMSRTVSPRIFLLDAVCSSWNLYVDHVPSS